MQKNDDDLLLFEIVNLLEEQGIKYWVSDGTLLGIIRDKKLLEWDEDIDIALLRDDVDLSVVIELFLNKGFDLEHLEEGFDCLHFTGKRKKIDINIYSVRDDIISIAYCLPEKNLVKRIKARFISELISTSISNLSFKEVSVAGVARISLIMFAFIVRMILSNKFLYELERVNSILRKRMGYAYPFNYVFPLKKIKYSGKEIMIPHQSELFLQSCYGGEWRKPRKDYKWSEEVYDANILWEKENSYERK